MLAANRYVTRNGAFAPYHVSWQVGQERPREPAAVPGRSGPVSARTTSAIADAANHADRCSSCRNATSIVLPDATAAIRTSSAYPRL